MTTTTLSEHLSTLPDALRRTLDTPLPALPDAGPVVFTGIGASGAVARHAAHVWQHAFDLDARALPISSLLEGPARDDVTWIVLSQGLSPNASLALRAVARAPSALLVTSVNADRAAPTTSAAVWTIPPSIEPPLLLRAVGPAAAALALFRLGAARAGRLPDPALSAVPDAVARSLSRGATRFERDAPLPGRAPFLASGWYARCLDPITWSWMEGCLVEAPPVYDTLELVHGPWQAHWAVDVPFLRLRRPDEPADLDEPLAAVLATRRERPCIEVRASLPGALAFFEHYAEVIAMVAASADRRGLDLANWPGRGTDEPLYGLGR